VRHAVAGAVLVVVVILAVGWIPSGSRAVVGRSPSSQGGLVDTIRFSEQANLEEAFLALKGGTMDIYTVPLGTPEAMQTAHTDPDLRVMDSRGSEFSLLANPVPVGIPGVFNPFAIREVREALNYLVDRNLLNAIVLEGYGTTHATLWNNGTPEVSRDPFFFADVNKDATYDFDRANAMVSDALAAAGATHDGSVWTWQGNPILVSFAIRNEDVRLDIGNYVANQLERLGLTVVRVYMNAGAAFSTVYFGPPDTGTWMIYTERWGFPQWLGRSDPDLDYFHCGGDGIPIWSFYSPPTSLEAACEKLLNGQYSDEAERQMLVEEGATHALSESVRVWLFGGRVQAYSPRVVGLVADAGLGLSGPLAIRTARFASPGGVLRVGQSHQLNDPFQPWRGFVWADDQAIVDTFIDRGVTSHPRTGDQMPVRADFTTTTAGPDGTLNVPSDALAWDPATMGFRTVDTGTTSKSVVRFQFAFGDWHHGSAINMDDVLYHIALIARRDRGDVHAHDMDAALPRDARFIALLRGLQVIDDTTLDVYIDEWNPDLSLVAAAADVWPATPWEVGELAMRTTLQDQTRISPTSATGANLAVVDLSRGVALGLMDRQISDGNITTLGPGVTRPPGLDPYVSQSEAEARWSAVQSWRADRGHYFVSNGPFFLDLVDTGSRQVTVTRFVDYPFSGDRWDDLLTSPAPSVSIAPIDRVVPGRPANVDLTTAVNGVPESDALVRFRIRSEGDTIALLMGEASLVSPGQWRVSLDPSFTETLVEGTHLFQAIASGNRSPLTVYTDRTFLVTADVTAPTSEMVASPGYWRTGGPIQLDVTAGIDPHGVASVALFVAYSASGSSWPSPTWTATVADAPYTFSYDPSSGDGRYRFWALATDGVGNSETLDSKSPNGEVEVGLDRVAPSIVSVVPADDSSGIASSGTVIQVQFGEAVDQAAAESAFSIAPAVAGTFSWDRNTLVFTPSETLRPETTYRVTIAASGIQDAAGNTLAADYTFEFATSTIATPPSGILSGTAPFAIGGAIAVTIAVALWALSRRRKP